MASEKVSESEVVSKPHAPDWLYANIAETSKSARSAFLAYLGVLAYSALTMVGTKDVDLLLNHSAKLPIIGLEFPLTAFVVVTPVLVVLSFIYLQLYMIHLHHLLRNLECNYEADSKLRLYPWVINVASSPLQKAFVNLTMWFLLPLMMMIFAVWVLKFHDIVSMIVVGLFPLLSGGLVMAFWRYQQHLKSEKPQQDATLEDDQTLRNVAVRKSTPVNWPHRLVDLALGWKALVALVLIFEALFAVAGVLAFKGDAFTMDLHGEILVDEKMLGTDRRYALEINHLNLQGANFNLAVLPRTDLKNAQLQRAHFVFAIVTESDLLLANLSGSKLMFADFSGARLQDAQFIGANLTATNFRDANLRSTKFGGAYLKETILQGADLTSAKFNNEMSISDVDFKTATLKVVNFKDSTLDRTNFEGVTLDRTDFEGVTLDRTNFEGATMTNVNFKDTTLKDVNFKDSTLTDVNFAGATLTNVNFKDADLSGIKNLSIAKMSNPETLCEAKKLPENISSELDCATPGHENLTDVHLRN